MEYNPRKVFLLLFGEGDTPEERAFIRNQTNSILDLIRDRTKKLEGELGNNDRTVLEGYLETVREIERRAEKAGTTNLSSLKIPNAPVGELEDFGSWVNPLLPTNTAPTFTKGADQSARQGAPVTVSGWATGISAGSPSETDQALDFVVSNDNSALFSAEPTVEMPSPAYSPIRLAPSLTVSSALLSVSVTFSPKSAPDVALPCWVQPISIARREPEACSRSHHQSTTLAAAP